MNMSIFLLLLLYIYLCNLCKKNIVIFYVESIKNNAFLSLHSTFFHSKILHVKWTGMNKGEQVKN